MAQSIEMRFSVQDLRDYLQLRQSDTVRLIKRAGVKLKRQEGSRKYELLTPKQVTKVLEFHLPHRRTRAR